MRCRRPGWCVLWRASGLLRGSGRSTDWGDGQAMEILLDEGLVRNIGIRRALAPHQQLVALCMRFAQRR